MSREILKDLDQSALWYRSSLGLPLSAAVSFDVPVSYAKLVKASMEELGVEMPDEVEPGCTLSLEFRNRNQITLNVSAR